MTAAPPAATRRWAARFGDWAVAVDMPLAYGELRRPWRGASGADTSLVYEVRPVAEPLTEATSAFQRLDADGFAFAAASCHGEGHWADPGTGTLWLHDAAQSQAERVQMLQEALFAAAFARLLVTGGLLLHAATLWIGAQPFVVAGPSTAGKSTLAARFANAWWSDEHAFLAREGDTWHVLRHVEFRGNEGDFPWRAPLAGILWLGPKRNVTQINELPAASAFQRLLPQALLAGPPTSAFVLDAVSHLCQHMPVYELSHDLTTPVDEVARTIAGVRRAPA